jgi:hypothetical protein
MLDASFIHASKQLNPHGTTLPHILPLMFGGNEIDDCVYDIIDRPS